MVSGKQKRAVGVFPDRPTTASALQALKDSGFSMRQVTILARKAARQEAIAGVEIQDQMGNKSSEGAAAGVVGGGILGGAAGLLAGLGALTIPGLSGIVLVSEAATAVATTLIGGAAGAAAGGLVGGLGIPEDRARAYSDRVARGEYLVLVKGTEPEIRRAEDTLQQQGIRDLGVYDVPERRSTVVEKLGALQAVPGRPVYAESPLEAPRSGGTVKPNGDNLEQIPLHGAETAATPSRLRHSANYPPGDRPTDRPVGATVPPTETVVGGTKRAMGVFYDQQGLEKALEALSNSNFTMHKISIVSRDERQGEGDRRSQPSLNPLSRLDPQGRVRPTPASSPLGGITGLLAGLNTVTIPGLGDVLVVGEAASSLKASLTKSGNFASALTGLGIPGEQAKVYGDRLSAGAILIMVSGSGEEALQAASILSQHGIQDWGIYDVTSVSNPFPQ